MTDGK